MNLDGTMHIAAPPERIAMALADPETLRAMLPGCTDLKPKGNGSYAASFSREVGPVTARLSGSFAVAEIDRARRYVFEGSGSSILSGSVKVRIRLELSPVPKGTELNWTGTAELGGVMRRLVDTVVTDAGPRAGAAVFRRLKNAVEQPPAA